MYQRYILLGLRNCLSQHSLHLAGMRRNLFIHIFLWDENNVANIVADEVTREMTYLANTEHIVEGRLWEKICEIY